MLCSRETAEAAWESGRRLLFWRETLSRDDAGWTSFLEDLWNVGADEKSRRLERAFPPDAPRHWLLTATILYAEDEDYADDPMRALFAVWKNMDMDGARLLSAVSSWVFMPWLKRT